MSDQIKTSEDDGPPSNIEGFITSHLKDQELRSKADDNVDTEKRDSFIARAIAESRRMNKEIQKSHDKRSRLYEEFGETRLSQWREEHSSQVLTATQANLVEESFKSQQ